MGTKITDTSKIADQASGVYFREIDLTVVTQSVGGFSAAAIGLTEKGPAFEISTSSTYEDRAFRLGELNPDYPTSYFAKQYLEQGNNYKEIRLLGLEGYTDTVGFAILHSISGSAAEVTGTSPLTSGVGALAAVLKKRPTTVTGRAAVSTVSVATVTYLDPVSGASVTAATDYLFNLVIVYGDSSTETITCSLRPESADYIVKKFGTDPLKTPKIKNAIASIWVDFVTPSIKQRTSATGSLGYYAPGSSSPANTLTLTTGVMNFGINTLTHTTAITNVNKGAGNIVQVLVAGDSTAFLAINDYVSISGVAGAGAITVNDVWKVNTISFGSGTTTITLKDKVTDVPYTYTGTVTFDGSGTPIISNYNYPTFETQVLDFTDVVYQTPLTPWFVSDGDTNGDFKRLFRLWSISDGESANTEIKVEIKNINPTTNNGNGSFDLVVKRFESTEDTGASALETFSNLTLDPKSNNFVQRRIGDGESFPLNSKFIFIEMNIDEDLQPNLLPFGVLGYPNVSGNKFLDVAWTTDFNVSQSIPKQTLGIANNSINCFRKISPSQLAYKSGTGVAGKGFHLNPNNNTVFATAQSAVFNFAATNIYKDALGKAVTGSAVYGRNKFTVAFYGGFDGWNAYSIRTWDTVGSKDYLALQTAVNLLKDKETIDSDFTVLTTPDFFFDTHPNAASLVLDMVQERGDALYIPDFSYDPAADTNNAISVLQNSNFKSNDAAVYFPWIQIDDQINKKPVWMPPSIIALGTITYTATNENVWQPPGGSIRTVTNNIVRARRRLVGDDRNLLAPANINPITYFSGSGWEIAGVRTTQEGKSALSYIHNRLLLCYAKKILNQTLRPLLFQLNGQITSDAFVTTVRPIFDRIKKLNGIDTFDVKVVDRAELNDRTTLYGVIEIVPLYPVERIIVDFVLQDGAISYNN